MAGSFDPGANQVGSGQVEAGTMPRPLTALQMLFLRRLSKLLYQREQCLKLVDAADWHLTLLNKAIYSTYGDCLALGLSDETGRLLRPSQEAKPSAN